MPQLGMTSTPLYHPRRQPPPPHGFRGWLGECTTLRATLAPYRRAPTLPPPLNTPLQAGGLLDSMFHRLHARGHLRGIPRAKQRRQVTLPARRESLHRQIYRPGLVADLAADSMPTWLCRRQSCLRPYEVPVLGSRSPPLPLPRQDCEPWRVVLHPRGHHNAQRRRWTRQPLGDANRQLVQ
jgi:hypothetical protein